MEQEYRLRTDPEIRLLPQPVSRKLERKMGSYINLIINRESSISETDVQTICTKASSYGIGAIIIPEKLSEKVAFDGVIFTYEEFYFSVIHTPYLFSKGVLCIFSDNSLTNETLYKNISLLNEFKYRIILYCNDQTTYSTNGKALSECLDGYRLSINQF